MIASAPFLAAVADKSVAIGVAVAALVVLYVAFKVTRLAVKMLLLLAAVAAIGLAMRWYFAAHNGGF